MKDYDELREIHAHNPFRTQIKQSLTCIFVCVCFFRITLLELLIGLSGLLTSGLSGPFLVFVSSIMTFAKTLLYFLIGFLEPADPKHPISTQDFWLMFVIPTVVWIIFPYYLAQNIWEQIKQNIQEKQGKKKN
jgi:hypothetical protein